MDGLHRSRVLASPWPGVYGTHIDSSRHFGRHSHATYGIGVLEDGAQRSASGQGIVEARAGDLIATNPGEVHDGRPLGGPSRRWRMVYLEPPVLAAMAGGGAAGQGLELTRPVIRDPRLTPALVRLLDRVAAWNGGSRSPADALACEEALVHACGLLLARHATAVLPDDAAADVSAVRDRLADELLDPPTLAELAAMAGLSRYQLLRRFARVHGLTPYAWLLQQRAERARHLIGSGAPLVDAAAAAGFADQSHMTRVFTRQFGFTPGAWQRGVAAPQ
ncbi:AraC family transcriptional regulator [Schlegelella sp. S2-27]|uniref:AraC family transcriptional regulator n=1 Tax=Caldimonas mangrovi TaxID=2944811 RepID=A0ABT0YSU6_9BURK|nr:AraC family transcriptional regulator [Caldimonas mangrovi]MCM5681815.1 AraC family transcriptional regulator [Caldimonas mangrovi]